MLLIWNLELPWTVVLWLGIALYCIIGITYRLYFSPLAKFPGPRLAAATLWYEAWYDIVKKGQYTFKIREMHKKYGPIIRISPYELHVDDPDYHKYLYASKLAREKYPWVTKQFGIPKATFSTVEHELHRLRRQPLDPFFSKASIYRLEPVISATIDKFCHRIEEFKTKKEPMPMHYVYRCLTTDIISLYTLNKSWDYIERSDFVPVWHETVKATAGMGFTMRQFPFLLPLFESLPEWILAKLSPNMILVLDWQKSLQKEVKEVIERKEKKIERQHRELPRTVFETLLESDLPAEEKSAERLWQEALLVIGAGTDTTSNALVLATFHLLSNPEKLATLRTELETVMPDPLTPAKLTAIENLPYLSACIQESLRFNYGISSRLARICPNEDLIYKDFTIPAGTPVGMTSVLTHHNETIFPDSYRFLPERWLGDDGRALDKYMLSFSRGSRACIGINLARAELYLTLATVIRRYDMELFDTVRERDVDMYYDGFLPQPSPQSKGVRVLFK